LLLAFPYSLQKETSNTKRRKRQDKSVAPNIKKRIDGKNQVVLLFSEEPVRLMKNWSTRKFSSSYPSQKDAHAAAKVIFRAINRRIPYIRSANFSPLELSVFTSTSKSSPRHCLLKEDPPDPQIKEI
jgi:hypothetical protein